MKRTLSIDGRIALTPFAKLILGRVQEKTRHDAAFDPREYFTQPGLEKLNTDVSLHVLVRM